MTPVPQSALAAVAQTVEAQSTLLAETRAQFAAAIEAQAAHRAEARERIAQLEAQLQQLATQIAAQKQRPGWWARLRGRG
jgi:septal ring factor EnvC (AmiA/AmiB activator)